MIRTGMRGASAVVLVEIAYVTVTAGIYAGLQQKALRIGSRLLGNLIIVLGVPLPAQVLDWAVHRLSGPSVTARATLAVSVYTLVSALFHLHAMRSGVFLTGRGRRSLFADFRRIPRLIAEFVVMPFALVSALATRFVRTTESEAAL